MKKCEQCEIYMKEEYGSGRFCSKECARSFSTKNKRADINKKLRKKMLGRKLSNKHIKKISGKNNGNWIDGRSAKKVNIKINGYCNSCGCKTGNGYCVDCRQYLQNKILFRKLNINEKNLQKANKLALKKLSNEYFDEKLSLIELKIKYKIMFNTIHFFFKKNGITLRSTSDAGSVSYIEGRSVVHSSPRYKQGWHITWNNKKVYYHSSYELDYAVFLDSKHIDYEMEFLRIKYFDTKKQKERIAIPDFYISKTNTIIEVKSTYTFDEVNMRDKFKQYKELGYNTKLILDHKEIDIQ